MPQKQQRSWHKKRKTKPLPPLFTETIKQSTTEHIKHRQIKLNRQWNEIKNWNLMTSKIISSDAVPETLTDRRTQSQKWPTTNAHSCRYKSPTYAHSGYRHAWTHWQIVARQAGIHTRMHAHAYACTHTMHTHTHTHTHIHTHTHTHAHTHMHTHMHTPYTTDTPIHIHTIVV